MVFSSVCNVLVRISCVTYTWRTRLNFYFVAMAEYISGPSSVYTIDLPRKFTRPQCDTPRCYVNTHSQNAVLPQFN